jgi:hypothetical protein
MIKSISATIALILACLAIVTFIALEGGDVVSAETTRPGNHETRSTHVWYVRESGLVYLEAGHPDNPWVQDLSHSSVLKLKGVGIDGSYRFTVRMDADSHERIRTLMRSKYGWRDRWISLLFNVSSSGLVELTYQE